MLTALCVALPARAGLTIIGGEGALVLGGLACAALPYAMPLPAAPPARALVLAAAAAAAGAAWIALAGVLRQWRGVNETISSLLLGYIAIALFKHIVEGPLRDPASLNKPSTLPLDESLRIGTIGRLRRALGPGLRHRAVHRWRRCGWAPRRTASPPAWSAATCARRSSSGCRRGG
jgi:general nucleoside transport system permease protein